MTDRSWGHGNGFAKPHAHDGVAGARKGTAAMAVLTIGARDAHGEWRVTLQVFRTSGNVGVFVDQAAQDGFSA